MGVLEWWKSSGLEMKWSCWSLDDASKEGHVHVLEWWLNSGLEMKWSGWVVKNVSDERVKDWWTVSGLV